MSFYADAANTADKLLKKYGQTAILRVLTPVVYDPTSIVPSSAATTDYPVTVALFDYTWRQGGLSTTANTMIEAGDKEIYMSAVGLTLIPQPENQVIAGGQTWTIKSVKQVNPAGTAVIYTLQGRT
ncbi:hypothetical protein [Solimicrobium silvestre]|uniref:Uncharacterized protein n=1 Tax=Solimicrobium silvestre TaxID=2099400 RepID=A0A2S9GY71_9BURK|nr:hypothetical protein [Solimicrobium silvestre]PRC92672.1 hypothetical protein S2091_2727 [Solimicrobium silvestre]